LQVENLVHICASEREGFGLYLDEARAVGAYIISTDHPPMNELVTPGEAGWWCVLRA
jgi:glycosyltransferase involved in cell wall biosynthesis